MKKISQFMISKSPVLQFLATLPKTASEQTIVISCEEDKAVCDGAVKAGIPVVSAEFILTGALRQEPDLNSYPFIVTNLEIKYCYNG